jgi:hypothetical protein
VHFEVVGVPQIAHFGMVLESIIGTMLAVAVLAGRWDFEKSTTVEQFKYLMKEFGQVEKLDQVKGGVMKPSIWFHIKLSVIKRMMR